MLKEQTFALVQCLVGLANWWSIESAIQFTSNTSTEQRAHMHVSSSDRCERTFSPQFPFSQRVRSMKSVSFAMLVAEKAGVLQTHETLCQEDSWLLMLLCDGFQNPVVTRNHVASSSSEQDGAED